MARAQYTHTVHRVGDQDVIALVDLGCSMTITNDAEAVVAELFRRGILQNGGRVIYQDTEGRWDELHVDGGRFAGFVHLGQWGLEDALHALEFSGRATG
jgi:hypothetical protein